MGHALLAEFKDRQLISSRETFVRGTDSHARQGRRCFDQLESRDIHSHRRHPRRYRGDPEFPQGVEQRRDARHRGVVFLVLSGIPTGLSWLCYY